MNTVCKRVVFEGRVQGVGFRYTACTVAKGYAVVGYVRNLPTGEVELIAEGEADVVQAFLDELARVRSANLRRMVVADEPSSGCTDFGIRHD